MWQVVGGGEKGGILVRDGESIASAQLAERLSTGAWLEEIELKGDRLHYKRATGSGPASGWISTRVTGKELVVKMTGERGAVPSELEKLPVMPPLPSSKWIARYKHAEKARCRLLVAFGAGVDATAFAHWYDYVANNFPAIELVLLEHPGHGANRTGPPLADASVLADRIAEEYIKLESSATEGISCESASIKPVLAMLGFSVGATLGHALLQKLAAQGYPFLRLYVCGRASPEVKYHHKEEDEALKGTHAEYLRWFVKAFTDKAAQQRLEESLQSVKEGNSMIAHIRNKNLLDLDMGNTAPSGDSKSLPCSIHVVASTGDKIWPVGPTSSVSGEYADAWYPPYENIVDTWASYTDVEVTSTIFDYLEHYELCVVPLLDVVCENLQALLVAQACTEDKKA